MLFDKEHFQAINRWNKTKLVQLRKEIPKGTLVHTPDGPGRTVSMNLRTNTGQRPCWQFVVQLDDGRIRHYNKSKVKKITRS